MAKLFRMRSVRSSLYKTGKLLGDLEALSSGSPNKLGKRVGRRVTGKLTGRFLRWLFK